MPDEARSAPLLESTVCAVAAADLRACVFFEAMGLDFGEDGFKTIADACRARNIDIATVERQLHSLDMPEVELEDLRVPWWALDQTCLRIVRHHHASLRVSLSDLRSCVSALADRMDDASPRVGGARARLDDLADALVAHFSKEENILFPAFAALAEARRERTLRPSLPFPSVLHPIRMMEAEHDRIARELDWLSGFAAEVVAPAEAVDIWRRCRSALASFSEDVAAHTHFEDALLFPRALDLERTIA